MNVSALNTAVANDDAAMHDLFSAVRQLQRIHTMPMQCWNIQPLFRLRTSHSKAMSLFHFYSKF